MNIELEIYKGQVFCIFSIVKYIDNFSGLEIDIAFIKKRYKIFLNNFSLKNENQVLQNFINDIDDYFEYAYNNNKHKKQIMNIIDSYSEELKVINDLGK